MQKRKIIAFLLAVLALIAVLPLSVFAVHIGGSNGDVFYCDNCNEPICTVEEVESHIDDGEYEFYCEFCGNYFGIYEFTANCLCGAIYVPRSGILYCGECGADLTDPMYRKGYEEGSQVAEQTKQEYYDSGYIKGEEDGRQYGYELGYADAMGEQGGSGSGEEVDTEAIYHQGYMAGLEDARAEYQQSEAYQDGYATGYAEAAVVKYQEGYEAGKKKGYEEGYAAGYTVGYNTALKNTTDKFQFGVFAYCTFNAILGIPNEAGETQSYRVEDLNLSFGYGYVYVGQAAVDQINAGIESATGSAPEYDLAGLDWVKIECIFATSFDWHSQPLYITGDSEIQDLSIISESGDLVTCNYEYKSSGSFSQFILPESWTGPFHCKRAILYIGRPVDLLRSFSLYSPSGQFYTGYDVGYAEGKKDTTDQARDEYFQLGYQQGLAKGSSISKDGTFTGLMAAVIDAPITAFSSLLNFEILGMNMKGFVTSILTLLLIVIILKKLI